MDGNGKDSFIGRLLGNAEKFSAEQVTQTVQLLLEHGIKWQASDIHIEPHDNHVFVRYRVDGILRGAHKINRAALEVLISHFKELSHLDVDNQITPQRGSFTLPVNEKPVKVTVATMPVIGGEKAVLHLIPQIGEPRTLTSLGLWGSSLHTVQTALARSHGMIIVSAPKHHGRPTTQASMLTALNNPGLNIATIEESVEYRIPHANQTVVNHRAGLTMLSGLQAALHQDPNVIMVGNLSDHAVADLAINTALTGHMVVAGMHSDSAANALLHLRAMHIPIYLIASSVRVVAAQRLVRQLCPNCRERYELNGEQRAVLEKMFGISSPKAFQRVHELEMQAIGLGLGEDTRPNSSRIHITHLWRPHREGCDACEHTGYSGRVALTEALPVTEAIQQAIIDPDMTASSLQTLAIKQERFVPLALDGLVKALRGLVTIKDVLHAVDRSLRSEA